MGLLGSPPHIFSGANLSKEKVLQGFNCFKDPPVQAWLTSFPTLPNPDTPPPCPILPTAFQPFWLNCSSRGIQQQQLSLQLHHHLWQWFWIGCCISVYGRGTDLFCIGSMANGWPVTSIWGAPGNRKEKLAFLCPLASSSQCPLKQCHIEPGLLPS